MTRAEGSGESGQLSVFVVALTTALLLIAGLVIDGGLLLTAKRTAVAVAEEAARAGAQALAVEDLRAGRGATLDARRASAAAHDHLAAVGWHGTVDVLPDRVTVTVAVPRRLLILSLGGLRDVTVTGRAAARPVLGVERPEPPGEER